MKAIRRIIVVALAYVAASIAVPFALIMFASISGYGSGITVNDMLVGSLMAGLLAAPFAGPVIFFTEVEGGIRWQWYVLVGVTPALVLTLVMFSQRGLAETLAFTAPLAIASLCGATTFWLIAWKLFPPYDEQNTLAREL